MRILIVEDEAPMRTALEETLRSEQYQVTSCDNGETALEEATSKHFDLILLDVMMPKLDGYTVCRELRRLGYATPILMLTAKGLVEEKVEGLNCGADDYLTKPFSLRELLARIRALLRRFEQTTPISDPFFCGNAEIQFSNRKIIRNGKTYELNEKELGILRLLIGAKGEPVSREQFLDQVWGYQAYPSTRTVDNFVLHLRKKIEENPNEPKLLLTVRGLGYRLTHFG